MKFLSALAGGVKKRRVARQGNWLEQLREKKAHRKPMTALQQLQAGGPAGGPPNTPKSSLIFI